MFNHLKDKYLELRNQSKKDNVPNTCYTTQMILALRDMAEKDAYPDGRFSDDECCIWESYHRLYA